MTDVDLLALHGLAVKKAGSPDGAKGTFMVAPPGREWLDERYPEVFADFRAEPAATEAYERFERINRELLALFTDWQMIPAAGGERVPNDHSDAEYDAGIVDRLGAQHERAEKVLDRFAELEDRLGVYKSRLDEAYDKVLAGDLDYVSGARIDSYHTVWFELHEDLLRMLGREREEAP